MYIKKVIWGAGGYITSDRIPRPPALGKDLARYAVRLQDPFTQGRNRKRHHPDRSKGLALKQDDESGNRTFNEPHNSNGHTMASLLSATRPPRKGAQERISQSKTLYPKEGISQLHSMHTAPLGKDLAQKPVPTFKRALKNLDSSLRSCS